MIRLLLVFISLLNSSETMALASSNGEAKSTLPSLVIIDDKSKKIDSFSMGYFYDESKELDIGQIQEIPFDRNISNRFSFGYIDGNSWFKVRVFNNSKNEDFVLRLNEPFFDEVNLFEESQNGWQIYKSGLSMYLKSKNQQDIHPTFFLQIKPNSSKLFYIQINSKAANFGKFEIYTDRAFVFRDDFSLYWFYFGTMIIVMLFNLFLFATIRDRIYIYYLGYVFFHTIFIFSFSGLSFYNITLASYANELEASVPLYILFLILFSNNFFKTNIYLPLMDKFLKFFMVALSFLTLLTLIDYERWFGLTIEFATLFAPLLIIIPIYVLIKGHKEMRYYIVAIIIYVISMIVVSLMTEGVIENSDFNHYFFIVGSYIEIVVFSFILANRFPKMQQELLTIKEEKEQILEKKVVDRTDKILKLLKEKELLVKEIHHRVKNNFQVLISLFAIEASKKKNQHHKNFLLELKNRIKSMSLIHRYLLNSGKFNEIESREYFANIINELKRVYSTQTINIVQAIDSYILSIEEAMSLGIIINELLANAIKHHPSKECNISISFKVVGESVSLSIEDDGVGFDKDKISEDGLGLDLIEQFSNKLNPSNSNDNFTFNNGTEFRLVWQKPS